MSEERKAALEELEQTLTERQAELIQMVIVTAEVQGDWFYSGDPDEGSTYEDDVQMTLRALGDEFDTIRYHKTDEYKSIMED